MPANGLKIEFDWGPGYNSRRTRQTAIFSPGSLRACATLEAAASGAAIATGYPHSWTAPLPDRWLAAVASSRAKFRRVWRWFENPTATSIRETGNFRVYGRLESGHRLVIAPLPVMTEVICDRTGAYLTTTTNSIIFSLSLTCSAPDILIG